MQFIPVFLSFKLLRQAFKLFSLVLLLCLTGCGSDDNVETPTPVTVNPSPQQIANQQSQNFVKGPDSQSLHDTAIGLFAVGVSTDDPAKVMRATALFEEAVTTSPDITAYWIDLADAYMLSDIPIQYPYAVDIYWMLLKEQGAQKNILLGRLSDAYYKLGNTQLAYDAALERFRLAAGEQINAAAYSFAYMAVANRTINPAIAVLQEKSNRQGGPVYLFLVESLLHEIAGDKGKAIALLDKAIAKSAQGTPLMKLAKEERRRLLP